MPNVCHVIRYSYIHINVCTDLQESFNQTENFTVKKYVGQLFPSLEDLVFLHGGLLLNLREYVASSKDVLVIHISDVLLRIQSMSLYVCATIHFMY